MQAIVFQIMQSMFAVLALCFGLILISVHCLLGFLGTATFGRTTESRLLSRIGATLMIVFFSIEYWVFQCVAQPTLRWSIVGTVLSALVLWSFFMTAWTDPGTSSCDEWQQWVFKRGTKMEEEEPQYQDDSATLMESAEPRQKKRADWADPGMISKCNRCKHMRPERAHHCKQCDRCILRMDHHCPLVGNCIGWRNHKYYILLQWWQFWACTVFLFAPGGPGETALFGHVGFTKGYFCEFILYVGIVWAVFIIFIALKSLVVAVLMAASNLTAVESNYVGVNPYKHPRSIENMRQLLGTLDIRLFLPVPCTRTSPGTSFPIGSKEHLERPKM